MHRLFTKVVVDNKSSQNETVCQIYKSSSKTRGRMLHVSHLLYNRLTFTIKSFQIMKIL